MKQAVAIFLILQALDLGITIWTLHLVGGDPTVEMNPLGRWLIIQAGWAGLAWGKAYSLILGWTAMRRLPARLQLRTMDFVNGALCLVLALNCVALGRAMTA